MTGISRRGLVVSGVAAATSLALGRAGAALDFLAGLSDKAIVARVKAITSANSLTALIGTSEISIELQPGAHVYKDAPAQLADFSSGERIVVEGENVDGVFMASTLVPLFDVIDTEVVAVRNSTLETRAGPVRISEQALYFDGRAWRRSAPRPLASGDRLQVVVRADPANGQLTGVRFLPQPKVAA